MSDYSDDQEYIEKLLAAFEEAIDSGETDSFDLDEILEIYDYASDAANEFIRLHALMEGLKRWPDDVELNERLAVNLYSQQDYEGATHVLDSLPLDSRLRQMLLAAMSEVKLNELEQQLDEIITSASKHSKLSDEEVIRLVEIISNRNIFHWAEKNFTTLKKAAEFPDTLMNELGATLVGKGFEHFRLKVLEEFANDYPLLHYAWEQLADFYIENEDLKKAENAVDNALAIAPENPGLLAKLARLMIGRGADKESLRKIVDKFYNDFPFDENAYIIKGFFDAVVDGKTQQGIDILSQGLRIFPSSLAIMSKILLLADSKQGMENAQIFIDNFRATPENFEELDREYERLMQTEAFQGAALLGIITRTLFRGDDNYFYVNKISEAIFRSQDYDWLVQLYAPFEKEINIWPLELVWSYATSLVKLQKKEDAVRFIDKFMQLLDKGKWEALQMKGIAELCAIQGLVANLKYLRDGMFKKD